MTVNQVTAGFSQRVISPEKGIALAGYFNNRYNEGIHDDLYTKAMVLSDGDTVAALVVADIVGVPAEVVEMVRQELATQTDIPSTNIFLQGTHTHTGPILCDDTWVEFSPAYREYFIAQTVAAVRQAYEAMEPVTFAIAEGEEKRVSFCRRYIMRDGTVATNPPKNSPDIVKPEGTPDHYLAVVRIQNLSGETLGVLVHCTNHTDSVGGNLVSADWPGVLCNCVAENIDDHPQVMLLNGTAGNMNHFDITNPAEQYGFDEAQKIGSAYAETALKLLKTELKPLAVDKIKIASAFVELPRLKLTEQQLDQARKTLEKTPVPDELPWLHSVDLAVRNEIVLALFAQRQLEFAEEEKASEVVEVGGLAIGELLIIGFPFEPFAEIGMEIKKRSPFKYTFPLELFNGVYGYLATEEAVQHEGGMETYPGVYCLRRFVPQAANILIDAAQELATSLA